MQESANAKVVKLQDKLNEMSKEELVNLSTNMVAMNVKAIDLLIRSAKKLIAKQNCRKLCHDVRDYLTLVNHMLNRGAK